MYISTIRPTITHRIYIWGRAAKTHIKQIQRIQNRIITDARRYMRNDKLHKELEIPTILEWLKTISQTMNQRALEREIHMIY